MYRWWTLSAGRDDRAGLGFSWLKLGPVTFAWGAWFGAGTCFEVHALNRLIFHHWSLQSAIPQR